jgi:hypothetical protein
MSDFQTGIFVRITRGELFTEIGVIGRCVRASVIPGKSVWVVTLQESRTILHLYEEDMKPILPMQLYEPYGH